MFDRSLMPFNYIFALLLMIPACCSAQATSRDSAMGATIFTHVDHMPETPFDFREYLAKNIHYPDSAIAHNIEGRVLVRFVVNENGTISRCKITKSVSKELDEEALRVVRSMPRWLPGRQNGKPVKVYFTLPIVFKLED